MTLSAGILLVDKPPGVTSHDVVDWIRFVTRVPTGHAGTLDPAATGLLVVLLGAATKLSELFAAEDKTYTARFRLGLRTRSDDLDGEILEQVTVDDAARTRGLAALVELAGEHGLSPPAVSAVHVDGTRAHVRARRGESFELPARRMTVFAVEGARITREGDLEATLRVSKGTYVRSLAVELGRRVGLPCALSGLRRIQSGRFSLDGDLPILTDLHVEARQRPDGGSSVRIRLLDSSGGKAAGAAEASLASVDAPGSGPTGAPAPAPDVTHVSGRAGHGGGSVPSSQVTAITAPVLSREASRAQIAQRMLPLVSVAPFPCVHAADDVARGWLRRLAMGQRLSAYEPGLCARFSRADPPERPTVGGPLVDGDTVGVDVPPPTATHPAHVDAIDVDATDVVQTAASATTEPATSPDYAAIYGTLEASDAPPPARSMPRDGPRSTSPSAAPSGRRESVLVLCTWSPAGDRLEPKRTIRGEVEAVDRAEAGIAEGTRPQGQAPESAAFSPHERAQEPAQKPT